MHPALSVIFFTTLSGVGYGLSALLALGLGNPAQMATKIAWVLALALIGAGLLSSTLHLGNPQRAWRAFSQWRSSWLSREGCMAVVTFIPLTILAALALFADSHILWVGVIGAVCCGLTVYCTAMIYASLRTVPVWHTVLTPICYLLFSLSSGLLLFRALHGGAPGGDIIGVLCVAIVIIAFMAKYFWARRGMFVGFNSSTIGSATGLGHLGKVKLLDKPHMLDNYLTKEMVFRVARKHNSILWKMQAFLALFVPVCLMVFALNGQVGAWGDMLFILAFVTHMTGLLVERWLFFANARHVVSLYYGDNEHSVRYPWPQED